MVWGIEISTKVLSMSTINKKFVFISKSNDDWNNIWGKRIKLKCGVGFIYK